MLILTIFIILIALLFDFLDWMNDAASSIATVVSTRVLSPRLAVIWAAFFNFVAAFGFGVHVADTIGRGIILPAVVTEWMILAALVGAIIWTHVCTRYGLPISVSHSLIGGLIGAVAVKAGLDAVIMSGILRVAIFIILSPIIGLVLGIVIIVFIYGVFRNADGRKTDQWFRVGC